MVLCARGMKGGGGARDLTLCACALLGVGRDAEDIDTAEEVQEWKRRHELLMCDFTRMRSAGDTGSDSPEQLEMIMELGQ